MRVLLITAILMVVTLTGCAAGTSTTAGAKGLLGGFVASETLKGFQADLEQREEKLIAQYNAILEAGDKAGDLASRADELEALKVEIADTVRLRQTSEVPAMVVETDWTDPKAAGPAIGAIGALAYAWINRKNFKSLSNGVKRFRAGSDEKIKNDLDQAMVKTKAVI